MAREKVEGLPTDEALRRLIEQARAAGAEQIEIEATHEAGDAWIRAGFTETGRLLRAPVEAVEGHIGAKEKEPSHGAVHVQTDDVDAVVRAVRQFVPRLPGGSQGSVVLPPREGWTSLYDELCDREPEMLRRLAREVSDRMGAFVLALGVEEGRAVRYVALERGRVVDEYLSVPEYYGPLPPGEVIALGANPRLMARLTGAELEAVRATARTAKDPAELQPAADLHGDLARIFGLDRGARGYDEARGVERAIDLPRA
ncbi:MAG: hypothetical protein ACRDON_13295 [Gaiellaceae bacterium]